MYMLEAVAPFALGVVGWQVSNYWIDYRQKQRALAPPKVVELPKKEDPSSFVHQHHATRVVFQKGTVSQSHPLLEELKLLGVKKAIMVCTGDPFKVPLLDPLSEIPCVVAHKVDPKESFNVQAEKWRKAVSEIPTEHKDFDCIIAYGRFTAISIARTIDEHTRTKVKLVCIPTTYSGYEMMNLTMYTCKQTSPFAFTPKYAYFDLVVYDVDCTLDLSKKYTTISVLTNLAHVMEGWCSADRSPLTEITCESALSYIGDGILRLSKNGLQDAEARYKLLVGAWLGSTVYSSSKMGVHHMIVETVASKAKLLYLHSLLLPYSLNAILFHIQPQIKRMALILDTKNPLQLMRDWLCDSGAPKNLQELGFTPSDLPKIVAHITPNLATLDMDVTPEAVKSILDQAYTGEDIRLPTYFI